MKRVLLNVFTVGDANFAIQSNSRRIKELKRLVREKKLKQCIEQKEHFFCTMNVNELEIAKKLLKNEELDGFIKKDNGHIPVYEMSGRAYSYFKRFEKFDQLDLSIKKQVPLHSHEVKKLSYFVGFKFLRVMSNLHFKIRREFGMFHNMVGEVNHFDSRYIEPYDNPLIISFANKIFSKLYHGFYKNETLSPVEISMSEVCETSSDSYKIFDGTRFTCMALILDKMRKNDYGFKFSSPEYTISETKRYIRSPLLHEAHLIALYSFVNELEGKSIIINNTQPNIVEVGIAR